jgi:SSS family solute:Na+ symporter
LLAPNHLSFLDWVVICVLVSAVLGMGMYFRQQGARNLNTFFISGRTLPWFLAGASLVSIGFSSDTPLWVGSLVRQHGVAAAWQFWAPMIGSMLAAVYFGRLWRRMGFVTDVGLFEARYQGRLAGVLRGVTGGLNALIICPLMVSWVIKGMSTIASETMGLPPESAALATVVVVGAALLVSVASGIIGLAYVAILQVCIGMTGTVILAIFSVQAAGGLEHLTTALGGSATSGTGVNLSVIPAVGSGPSAMSVWNAVGIFLILSFATATSGAHSAQRLLASKDQRHASFAQLFHAVVYFGLVAWPWILVALASLIVLPDLQSDDQGVAFPRMIMHVLPSGLRGLVVAAMICAFLSTVSALFNWGASYLTNDIFKRFIRPRASDFTNVLVARVSTIVIAAIGTGLSLWAEDIQQLLTMYYVLITAEISLRVLRWQWWRLTVEGDLVGTLAGWGVSILTLFTSVLDQPAQIIMGWDSSVRFSTDADLFGARMLFVLVAQLIVVVAVSLSTKPTAMQKLTSFVQCARPIRWGWGKVICEMQIPYGQFDFLGRIAVSWLIGIGSMTLLVFGFGEVLLGGRSQGGVALFAATVGLVITIRRMRLDFDAETTDLRPSNDSGLKESI